MKNFNWTKCAAIGGMVLSVVASLLNGYSNKKAMEKTVKKEIEKALTEQR